MRKYLTVFAVSLAFTAAVVVGAAGCSSTNNNNDAAGAAGHGGSGGSTGTGGTGTGGTGTGGAGGLASSVSVTLTGAMEVPTTTSTGTATVTVSWDAATMMVTVDGTFSGLTSNANNAHLHGPAAVGVSAGVLFPLTFTAATSGTVSGSGTLSATNWASFLAGMTYVNIHTVNNPGGEIRGQVVLH